MKKDNNFLKIYCLKNAMNYLKEIKLQFILKLVISFLITLVPMKEFMIFWRNNITLTIFCKWNLLCMKISMNIFHCDEYIVAIRSKTDNTYDMLNHKNSKFLFYNFNGFLDRINQPVQLIRYTTVADDDCALVAIQEKGRPYFIERILSPSERNPLEIKSLGTAVDINESRLILDMMANLDIVKAVDNNLYRTVVDNLTECLTEYQYFIKSKFFQLEFWFHKY